MKLTKENKDIVIALLGQIDKLTAIDNAMYEIVPRNHDIIDKDIWIYYEWYKCQDVVFRLMADTTHEDLNNDFGTPANDYKKPKKPIGWYQATFSEPGKYILGPVDPDRNPKTTKETYSGYIPDRMTDVVFHAKVSPKKRYKLLRQMFKDLKQIKKEFKECPKQSHS